MNENQKKYKKHSLALDTWVKLSRAHSTFARKVSENIRSFNLTPHQFAVMEVLFHQGPLKVGEICSKILVSGGNMTVILDNLEKNGYVERVVSPDDRRATNIQLTQSGSKIMDNVFTKHAEHITNLMDVLTKEEQNQIGEVLKKLGLELSKLP